MNAHDSSISGVDGLQNGHKETEGNLDFGWPRQGREIGSAPTMSRRRRAKYDHALLPPAMRSIAWASRGVHRALCKKEQARPSGGGVAHGQVAVALQWSRVRQGRKSERRARATAVRGVSSNANAGRCQHVVTTCQ
jgi:hypothetical protein